MITKIGFGSPKRWHFLMRAMHQFSVPKEANQEDETEGCNECEKEFFPVHNFFLLRFLASPIKPRTFIAKADSAVDLKIFAARTCSHRPVAGQSDKVLDDGSQTRGYRTWRNYLVFNLQP